MNDTQKTELLYKKYLDLPTGFVNTFYSADTALGSSSKNLNKKNIRSQPIPPTAPTALGSVVSITNGSYQQSTVYPYMRKYTLTLGSIQTNKTFWYASTDPNDPEGTNLCRGAIPATFDPLGSYNITVNANGTPVSANYADYPWNFDVDAGVLTFYPTTTIPTPVTITFWRYVGSYGDSEIVLVDTLSPPNYWYINSYGDLLTFTNSTTGTAFTLSPEGLLILGSSSTTNTGLRLDDRTTTNYWDVYSTGSKINFAYNGTSTADLSQTGNLILKGTDARIQFRESTVNDQRLYWNSTYGLILDSPTTSSFGGRILLNQLSLQTGGYWNNLTGIDLNAKPITNASTITCSGNITTSTGDIVASIGNILAVDGSFSTQGVGAGYYNYDRSATPGTTWWLNYVASGAATSLFVYRIPSTTTNLEIFRMTNTGLLSTIGSFTNGATGKGLQLGDRATTGATGWQIYNDTAIFNCAYQSTLSGALATKFRCNASGQFDILGTLASLNLADRSNNANFWANYHNGGTLGWYNSQDRMTLTTAGKLSIDSDLDVGVSNPATTTINMSGTTRCQITTTLATMGTLIWDVGYMNLSSGTVSSAVGTIEVSTTKFAYYHTAPLYNGMPFACSKLGELEVNHDTNSGGGSSLWYVPCYWNSGASPIGGIKQVNTTTVSFPTTSDRRLKEQIEDLTEERVGGIIDTLKPRAYVWKESQEPAIGFIADELQAVMPDCVYGEPDAVNQEGKPEYQTADSASPSMIAVLVAELQFLRKRVSELEKKSLQI